MSNLVKLMPQSLEQLDVQKLLDSFLSGRSKQTLEAYSGDLLMFANFLNADDINDAVGILLSCTAGQANTLVLDYKNWMVDRGYASATINRRLASLRSVVKLGRTLGMVTFEIEISNMRVIPYRDTRGPLSTEVQIVLDHLNKQKTPKSTRDTSIIRVLHDLALRASELVGLDLEDYDSESGTLSVLGKGRREKELLELPEATKEALDQWIKYRGKTPGSLYGNFVRAPNGGMPNGPHARLTRQGLRDILIGLAKRAGVTPKSPHGYRHRSITEAIKRAQAVGLGLEDVMDHSRHSRGSIGALMAYLDRINNVQGKISKLVADDLKLEQKDE